MKILLYTYCAVFLFIGSCAEKKHSDKIHELKGNIQVLDSSLVNKYAKTITVDEMKKTVYEFASEQFLGRKAGEDGQHKAANYIKDFYVENNIASPLANGKYLQYIDKTFFEDIIKKDSENVLAFIEGSEKPDEVIIISAHLDHLGIDEKTNEVYYGADDNASGVAAAMQIAQAFKTAKTEGNGPKRTILFLHVTAEEDGLYGSRYYVQNPVFPLQNTVCNLNIDMIGRTDAKHKNNKNYLYLIGSNKLSTELHYISEKVNKTYFNIFLDYNFNDEDDLNRFYYRSDHYNFAKHGIPVIFYFNGTHEDYHLPSDTPDKIDYDLLTLRSKLIFATAWQLANQDTRIVVDKALE